MLERVHIRLKLKRRHIRSAHNKREMVKMV